MDQRQAFHQDLVIMDQLLASLLDLVTVDQRLAFHQDLVIRKVLALDLVVGHHLAMALVNWR